MKCGCGVCVNPLGSPLQLGKLYSWIQDRSGIWSNSPFGKGLETECVTSECFMVSFWMNNTRIASKLRSPESFTRVEESWESGETSQWAKSWAGKPEGLSSDLQSSMRARHSGRKGDRRDNDNSNRSPETLPQKKINIGRHPGLLLPLPYVLQQDLWWRRERSSWMLAGWKTATRLC